MLDRSERERTERSARIQRLEAAIARDEQLGPLVSRVITVLDDAAAAIAERLAEFRAALAADREAGEHVAVELRACAQEEATLHSQLHSENEALTAHEVRAQRVRDQVAEVHRDVHELAGRLELEAAPAESALSDEERDGLTTRLGRLNRRREQLGPVNPLAQEEYAGALEHVEELERQRADLETALRELEKLIADTDQQIKETFEETFEAAARNFEELSEQLFPGGRGRLRLVSERGGPAAVLGGQPAPESPAEDSADEGSEGEAADGSEGEEAPEEDVLGVEIEITPAGKAMKRLSLLSGG
jgi:chromosome segregation protein